MLRVMEGLIGPFVDLAWSLFDAATAVFALVFYLFVAWLGMYAIASVVYNAAPPPRRHCRRTLPPVSAPSLSKVNGSGTRAEMVP